MNRRSLARAILCPPSILMMLALAVLYQEGWRGFRPFLDIAALALVLVPAFMMTWMSYPLKDIVRALWASLSGTPLGEEDGARARRILAHAADSSMAAGAIGVVLGLMLMLHSIDDIAQVPRRLAFILASLFFALLLSEAVFIPLSRRLCEPQGDPRHGESGSKRLFMGFLSIAFVLFAFMVVLYALTPAGGCRGD